MSKKMIQTIKKNIPGRDRKKETLIPENAVLPQVYTAIGTKNFGRTLH